MYRTHTYNYTQKILIHTPDKHFSLEQIFDGLCYNSSYPEQLVCCGKTTLKP